MARAAHPRTLGEGAEALAEPVEAEIRQGAAPVEDDHGDGGPQAGGSRVFYQSWLAAAVITAQA